MTCAFDFILNLDRCRLQEEEALLIVAFPTKTVLVPGNSEDRLHALEGLLEQGGIPVGHLNLETIEGLEHITCCRLFDDVADPWAKRYMKAFIEKLMDEPLEKFVETIGIDEFRIQ
jgi:hypothetical protein